jgi:hypothetical protein
LEVIVPSAFDVAGDVVAAATTLGGLVLVFLGAAVANYESYDRVMRTVALRNRYRRRAWLIFIGFVLAVIAALAALGGKCYAVRFWIKDFADLIIDRTWDELEKVKPDGKKEVAHR